MTRNFVGARGIEAIFTTTTSGTTTAFPLYDCHGNMEATLARSGPGFTTSNVRTYDVWGGVRTGASTGGPKGRYVANLGHVQDYESGLIYMRARYYEPESSRFISEDPAMDGSNWFIYSRNAPIVFVDGSGMLFEQAIVGLLKFFIGHILMGQADILIGRLDQLTKYMAVLDDLMSQELITGAYKYTSLSDDAMEIRREVVALHKELYRIKKAQGILNWGSKLGKGLDRILGFIAGYCLILSALIDDVYLAADEFGSLDVFYGGS